MSVEPVTVVVTVGPSEFGSDLDAIARAKAAEELGLEENQIMCISRGPAVHRPEALGEPDEEEHRERLSEASLSLTSTWAPAITAERKVVVPVAWPDIKLGRGSRWNGMIPDPNDHSKAIEATLISDGVGLVHLDSPEGKAILRDLRHPDPTASPPDA